MTKGPWKYWVRHTRDGLAHGVVHTGDVPSAGVEIAIVKTTGDDGLLLAAAPEMLTFLEELYEDVHSGKMQLKDNKTLLELKQIIDKAGGERR